MQEESISVECEECSHINVIYLQDMDFEVNSYERQMGAENEYSSSTEIVCENCGEEISIDYSAWEYPVGCYNTSNIEVSGGELVSIFNETEMFQEKYYDFDQDKGLYLPQEQEIISSLNIGIANLILAAQNTPELITHIKPREFEEFVADLFKRQGFTVELTPQTRDGGRDIIAVRSDLNIKAKYLIECKRYQFGNTVGVDVVRQLYGVQQAEGANKSIVVTTSKFTQGAIDFTNMQQTQWQMDLIDYNELVAWVKNVYGEESLYF